MASLSSMSNKPVESHSEAREDIIAGPYPLPHSVCLEIETPTVERAEMWGGMSPHHPTRVLGEHRKLLQGAENGFYTYFTSERIKAIWNTIFSIFEQRRGPGKLSPLSTGLLSKSSWVACNVTGQCILSLWCKPCERDMDI